MYPSRCAKYRKVGFQLRAFPTTYTTKSPGSVSDWIHCPWALTATGIGFNVPGVKKLNLTGPLLAQIYFGKVTKWNDPKIRKINKKAHLPNLPITPVYRSDGSGDTYAFTEYLSHVSKAWKKRVGFATSVGFPEGQGVGAKGNSGVTATVKATKGGIGYISASYLIAAGLGAAALKNKAGNYELPNIKNIASAAGFLRKLSKRNTASIVDPPKKQKIAYPLSTFTYAIIPHDGSNLGETKAFAKYAVTIGQKYGAALDFAPLPKFVKKAALRAINSL